MQQTTQKIVKREISTKLKKHLEKQEITILSGARQVGKTTLLKQLKKYLINKGYPENQIITFNLDTIYELELFQSQQKFINFLKERTGKQKLFVFIDEAQRVENAGIFFKGIYDLNLPLKFVLTGSSSLEIKSKIHEPLTGRKRVFHLYPFSFAEYLSSQDEILSKLLIKDDISTYDQNQILEHLFSFINWGGYPNVALENNILEKKEILKEIFSSYLEKDIIGFLKIRNPSNLTNLATLLSAQTGQLLNTNTLSKSLKTERKTLENYLEILEKTFVIKRIPPFFKNYRKEIVKMPKPYFLDTGLRNFSLGLFQNLETRPDKGQLLENFIFSELLKHTEDKLHFWRTREKTEIDFVITDLHGNIIPIEVKSNLFKKPEVPRAFRNFITHYQPKQAFVINLGFQGKTQINNTTVSFILPYEIKKITDNLNSNTYPHKP